MGEILRHAIPMQAVTHEKRCFHFLTRMLIHLQWSVWFEFFLLIVMLVTCFLNAFERARFIYLTYLTLVTSLLTITSRNFITATVQSYYNNNGTINIKDTKQSANNAAAAGAIMLCITNYALIIFIGLGKTTFNSHMFMVIVVHVKMLCQCLPQVKDISTVISKMSSISQAHLHLSRLLLR